MIRVLKLVDLNFEIIQFTQSEIVLVSKIMPYTLQRGA